MTADQPGFLRGQHYTAFVGEVERLVRAPRGVAAERLLLDLIGATEAAASIDHLGVAPWYYEQLANVYQRRGDPAAEQAILTRFRRVFSAPGTMRRQLLARLKALETGRTGTRRPAGAAPRPGPSIRTCALASCAAVLTATQAKYCSPGHARAAILGRPR